MGASDIEEISLGQLQNVVDMVDYVYSSVGVEFAGAGSRKLGT
jgi:hypothetical protein